MAEAVIDHLWQSSLCALVAALATLAFRKDRASVRFAIWCAASLKFLIPFSVFVLLGTHLRSSMASALHATRPLPLLIDQITQPGALLLGDPGAVPATSASAQSHSSIGAVILVIWAFGMGVVTCRRVFQWLQLRRVLKASSPLNMTAPIPVREAASALEPGIFGIFSPTLLLPAGLTAHLEPGQLAAILAHELSHWRRKDNLTAALHMLVEILFWFHPLVWWVGNRLLVERERACDEAVIESGSNRQAYAEGILKVCRLYLRTHFPCAAGVSGGRLNKRIEAIMTHPRRVELHFGKKCLLSVLGLAAIAGPSAVGFAYGTNQGAPVENLRAGVNGVDMQHYLSSEWKFALDIPKTWNAFPAVPTNSPYEVIRFAARENKGSSVLIVFRNPHDPQARPEEDVDRVRQILTKAGFSNFAPGETVIGSKRVLTLDFDRPTPDGGLWSCRQYFIADGTLLYVLGFGTTRREAMFGLFDRVAKTFTTGTAPG